MSYCPDKYPVLKIQDKVTKHLVARVIYSRQQKNSRTIFGELVEYGKIWRLGADLIIAWDNVKVSLPLVY